MNNEYFEMLAAKFVAAAASSVSTKLISSVFASPLSARSPDLCMLWHPGYRNTHRVRLFLVLLFSIFSESIKGIIRLGTNLKSYEYAIYGKIKNTILVVTSICGSQEANGEYKTV